MNESLLVFLILATTIVLFASDRLRLDVIALMALLALMLTNILTTGEALAGFADSLVLMIAGLFIVGGGIFQTGVAEKVGTWLGRIAGGRPWLLLIVVMLVTAFLSAFISSTGTVAVMLPIVVSLARDANLRPSQLLIPLAFASLLGGMTTLIGTPPNLIVSNQLQEVGLEPFAFFAFTPIGVVMLLLGIVFMLLFGWRMLPKRTTSAGLAVQSLPSVKELLEDYELSDDLHQLIVPEGSPLNDQSLHELAIRSRYRVNILAIATVSKRGDQVRTADPDTVVHAGDSLYVKADAEALQEFIKAMGLQWDGKRLETLPVHMKVVETIVRTRSSFRGRNLKDIALHSRYGVTVLAIKRAGQIIRERTSEFILQTGDTLLIAGSRRRLSILRDEDRDLVIIVEPEELLAPKRNTRQAPLAILIMLAMLVLMTLGVVANVTAVLLAAVAMVLVGCLSMEQAYGSINWESVVLIAAILPMATALEKTGGMQLIVDWLLNSLGNFGPMAMMLGLFVLTSAFSQVISNTATTVLIAPIAYQTALNLEVAPQSFLIAVAIAASTAFCTPIASPVNTLVLNPGGYRFSDFFKVGIALQFIVMIATMLLVPWLFPL